MVVLLYGLLYSLTIAMSDYIITRFIATKCMPLTYMSFRAFFSELVESIIASKLIVKRVFLDGP